MNKLTNYPPVNPESYGRQINVAQTINTGTGAVIYNESGGQGRIMLYSWTNSGRKEIPLTDPDTFPHRPLIITGRDNTLWVVWNTYAGDKWEVRGAVIDSARDRILDRFTVCQSRNLILPPAICWCKERLLVAWPEVKDNKLAVLLSSGLPGRWDKPVAISTPGVDANRVSITSDKDRVLVAWDEHKDGSYRIAWRWGTKAKSPINYAGDNSERWLSPVSISEQKNGAYIAFIILKEVYDPERDIWDHWPGIAVAKIEDEHLHLLEDSAQEDTRFAADLREGLLGDDYYIGYHGLRRRPQLAARDDGTLWLFWELMYGPEKNPHRGHLAGRGWDGTNWSEPLLIHHGMTCYAVPNCFNSKQLPVCFLNGNLDVKELVDQEIVAELQGIPFPRRGKYRQRWKQAKAKEEPTVRYETNLDNKTLKLYWLDTHCHSVFSPDAEGEPDELINYARDVAHLDGMAIVDNDYYPFKSYSPAEWQIQQALAAHFTKPGEFVVFSGYEFTYHRRDLTPNFNHRYVIYPKPGGRLVRRIDREGKTDRMLVDALYNTKAILVAHHCTWQLMKPGFDQLVEVCSSWRVCIEETDFIIKRLLSGDRFGFIGSSDSHRACPGRGGALTGVYATALTPEALYEAYKNRRTIATQGQRMAIDFRINDTFIGGETSVGSAPVLHLVVRAPAVLEFVEIIRDGIPIKKFEPRSLSLQIRFADRQITPGEHFYFIRVKCVGEPSFNVSKGEKDFYKPFINQGRFPGNFARARGPFAWSGPIWVKVI